jgi:zinc protease
MPSIFRSRILLAACAAVIPALSVPALAAKKPKPAPAPPPVAAPAPPERVTSVEGITEYRLANGLRVLLFPDPTKQTITVNLTVLVGSRHENYGETGMAHLLEHMVFKGSPRHPDIPAELTAHGARPNGTTNWDRTNYFETFAATEENFRWALDLEADRMMNSFIRKEDLDTEMTVVRNEYEAGENSPTSVLFKRLFSVAYDWHNYAKLPIGARSDIEGVPIERLQAFYKTYYQPDNAVLVIAGKIEEARALALVQEYFGPIPRPTRVLPKQYTLEPVQDGERQVTLRRAGDVQATMVAYHVPAGTHEDFAPLQILAQVMGDTPGGRMHKELVETQKAAQVFAAPMQLAEPGLAYFGAIVRQDKPLDAALATLLASIESTSTKPITDAEVERARTFLLKQIELNLNNSEQIGLELSNWMGMGDWRLIFLNRDRLRAVKTADVQRVWARYIKPSNRTAGLFYPTKQPDRAEIPAKPDVLAMVKDYKGDAAKEAGEAFDPSTANIDARTQRSTLPGGLKLALLPKKTRGGSVVMAYNFHIGDEKSLMNKSTIGGFVGAMLMRGSAKHTRQQIEDEFDRLKARVAISGAAQGGAVNVETTRENLPAVMSLVTEVLRQPVFDAKELEQLRTERLAGLEQQKSEPQPLASNALARHMNTWPKGDVRYVESIDEQIAAVKAVTREQLVQFHKEFYGGQAGQLAVVGDFDPAALTEQVRKELGDWKAMKPYARVPNPYKEVAPTTISIETPDKANAFFMAGLGFPMRDDNPDYPALLLGNYMLGGSGLKSRLNARIRIKEGLSYGAGSQFTADELDEAGGFVSYAIYAPQNLTKLEQVYKEEMLRAVNEEFTADEVAQAKSGWLQGRTVSRAQDRELVRSLVRKAYFDRTFQWDADLETKVAALTPAQIKAVMAKYIQFGKLTVVKAGDFAKAATAPAAGTTAPTVPPAAPSGK